MNARSNAARKRTALIFLLGSLAVAGSIGAAAAFAGRGDGAAPLALVVTPTPSDEPVVKPTQTPDDIDVPGDEPGVDTPGDDPGQDTPGEDPGTDAMPIHVAIHVVGGDNVYVDIVDETGRISGAYSGPAAEGASVDTYTLKVENVDADTLKLTWVDYAIDNALELYALSNDGVLVLNLIQPEPEGDVDTFVMDRVLFLDFAEPISAADVEGHLMDGTDTPGWAGYEGEG